MAIIQDILNQKSNSPLSAAPDTKVDRACKLMSDQKVGCILIIQDKKLIGLFTERDLMNKVVALSKDPQQTTVSEVMTTRVAVGQKEMAVQEAGELMSHNRIRHLPIVENDIVVNIISSGDILALKLKENESTVRHLENYFLA